MEEFKTFEEWFDNFQFQCKLLGYDGVIDEDSFEFDFENNKDPKEVAKEFVAEMNS